MFNENKLNLQEIQELEKSLLCAFMEDKEVLAYGLESMSSDDFYFHLHGTIFVVTQALVDDEIDFNIEELAEIIHEMNNDISIDIILDVFFTLKSQQPMKDIEILQEISMARYGLKQKISKDNVTLIGIEDKNCFWSVKYINNELYEVEGNIIIDSIPAEYKVTLSETIASINDKYFSGGAMLPWHEDEDSITKYLFKR